MTSRCVSTWSWWTVSVALLASRPSWFFLCCSWFSRVPDILVSKDQRRQMSTYLWAIFSLTIFPFALHFPRVTFSTPKALHFSQTSLALLSEKVCPVLVWPGFFTRLHNDSFSVAWPFNKVVYIPLKHNQGNPCHAFTFLFIRQVFFSFVYNVCHGTAVILSWDIRVGFDRSSLCFCYKNDPLTHHEGGDPLTYVLAAISKKRRENLNEISFKGIIYALAWETRQFGERSQSKK